MTYARCKECRRLITCVPGPLADPTNPLTGRRLILRTHKEITAAEFLASGQKKYVGRPECRGSRTTVREDDALTGEPGPSVPPAG